MTRRALLLLNRKAGQGENDSAADELKKLDIEVVQDPAASPKTASDTILKYRDRVDLVIVGGGDGSMNSAARGLVPRRKSLHAVIPACSGR